jgi:hypothetical protein
MNFHSNPSTVSNVFRASAFDLDGLDGSEPERTVAHPAPRQLPHRLHRPRLAAYVAFFITVFASMAAAAALATHDMPLMVVGL